MLRNFLGCSPKWYKLVIISFLVINPICFFFNNFIAGWILIIEFIFTLSMALKCYPLQPGGLLSIEALILGMTSPEQVTKEIYNNIEVLLLLIFMVAGIYFMKELLLLTFTKLLLSINSKKKLSLSFCLVSVFLSAFLDALTVIAVIISVSIGFYSIYTSYISNYNSISNKIIGIECLDKKKTLVQFQSFLRSLIMHSGIGTALGGVMTMVGEPQNLIIAKSVGWNFNSFFLHMIPVTFPVFLCTLLMCYFLEHFKIFGYGEELPKIVRDVLTVHSINSDKKRTKLEKLNLLFQCFIGIFLIISLAFHLAEVSLIGLFLIILTTSFCGIVEENKISHAFRESLPFVSLLMVFFLIISIIINQNLFSPFINFVFNSSESSQLLFFYLFNGFLSFFSDNVFVGTIYINEALNAFKNGLISHDQYEYLAVAINAGTNLPSVATPNGQASFLFLLTSNLSPLIKLSYSKMVIMALPYTVIMTFIGFLSIRFWLIDITNFIFY